MYRYVFAIAICITASSAWAETAQGPFVATVSTVLEGDVIEVNASGVAKTIRVFGIDSPDENQPHFESATEFTQSLVGNAELVFEPRGTDISDRLVCEVVLPDGRDLGRELARSGWAWRYKAHAQDELVLTRLTFEAMESKQGLWANAAPLAPWDFRGERLGDEVFFPFSDDMIETAPPTIAKSLTIDLTATDRTASEKSVTINPDGSRRLVLKGNHKQSDADIAFIQNSNRIMRNAVAQRAEEKRANAQAHQNTIQSRIQTNIAVTESRQRTRNTGYGISGPVIISGGFGFPQVYISPWQRVESTPNPHEPDLWPYVQTPR